MKKTFDRKQLEEKDWDNTSSRPHTNLARFQLQFFSDEWLQDFKIGETSRSKAYKTWVFHSGAWCEKDIRDDFFRLPSQYYLTEKIDKQIKEVENRVGSTIRDFPFIFTGVKPSGIKNINTLKMLLLELYLLTFLRKEGLKQDHLELVSEDVKKKGNIIGKGMYYEEVIDFYLFSGNGLSNGAKILLESFDWEIILSSDPFRLITGNRTCIEFATKQTEDHETIEDRIRSNSMILFPVSSFCCLLGLAKDVLFRINGISIINSLSAAQCDEYIISSQKGFHGDEFVKDKEFIENIKNPWFGNEIAFFSENLPGEDILKEDTAVKRYKM